MAGIEPAVPTRQAAGPRFRLHDKLLMLKLRPFNISDFQDVTQDSWATTGEEGLDSWYRQDVFVSFQSAQSSLVVYPVTFQICIEATSRYRWAEEGW